MFLLDESLASQISKKNNDPTSSYGLMSFSQTLLFRLFCLALVIPLLSGVELPVFLLCFI